VLTIGSIDSDVLPLADRFSNAKWFAMFFFLDSNSLFFFICLTLAGSTLLGR
jgi:hypothetical protein